MLTRDQLLKMLVGLRKVNDIDLVDVDEVLRVSCRESDRKTVRSMAAAIDSIYGSFDYTKSPEFESKLQGKSNAVREMQLRLLNSEKRADALRRLADAITSVLHGDDAYQLVARNQHHHLDELRTLAMSISE